MITLTVGLQDCYPKRGSEWDQDAGSELVNRIGKKLEQIGRMDIIQMTDALTRAECGGFIRWHVLATVQGSLLSSTCRNTFQDWLSVSIVFQEPNSAFQPFNNGIDDLGSFVRAFGDDLEQLRMLTLDQVNYVGYGLSGAGFVKDFLAQEPIQNNSAAFPDPSQPTQSTLAAPQRENVSTDTTHNQTSSSGEEGQKDWTLYPIVTPQKPSVTQLLFEASSPGNKSTPGTEGAASSYLTLLTPHSPGVASQPPIGDAFDLPISTPRLDEAYPTPTTDPIGTPRMRDQLPMEFGATLDRQSRDTNGLSSESEKQTIMMETLNISNRAALNMLQSCSVSLDHDRIQRILEVEPRLLAKDLENILKPLFDIWNHNRSLDLQALGLPVEWKGLQAAVNYLRVLDTDATSPYLNPVAKRIGYVLLYFNYEELCKYPAKYCPTPPSKPYASHVLGCILQAYPDDPRIADSDQSRRNKITTYYVRRGKWWWMLAANWGAGILLAGDSSPHDVIRNHTFKYPQIQVFVTFVQKTRPGTIRVFQALEPIVKLLMFGQMKSDLRKVIFDEDVGLLRPNEMLSIRENDARALTSHWIENSWRVVDVEGGASRKLTEFLS